MPPARRYLCLRRPAPRARRRQPARGSRRKRRYAAARVYLRFDRGIKRHRSLRLAPRRKPARLRPPASRRAAPAPVKRMPCSRHNH
ncbi:hypothetical protein YA29_10055 [Klebsiella aerogenes]|nr:hypothetical protein YA29_10055 [Klebsiella aerogenes]